MAISLSTRVLTLPLKKPFKIFHGTFPVRKSLIVSLQADGYTGYGEASEISYYDWDIDTYLSELEAHKADIEELEIEDPRNIKAFLEKIFPSAYPLQSALDCALWDLFTQKADKALWDYLDLNPADAPLSSYTISIDEPAVLLNEMKENDWPILKLKLGAQNDLEILKSLIEDGFNKPLRVDANEGWSLPKFSEILQLSDSLPLEFIEQPLPVIAEKGMSEIQEICDIPLIADESCQTIEDVERCAEYFDGINIKLMKCGGISSALKMIELAQKHALKIMGGCMTETGIGISALCNLAPLMDYLDADGAELLSTEPARGVLVKRGQLYYPARTGLGARFTDEAENA